MREPHERLQFARHKAGYRGATAAANAFGWNENTYRSHENGARGFKVAAAKRYGKAFHVPAAWLLTGDGWPDAPAEHQNDSQQTITVVADDFRRIVALLLRSQGADQQHADDLADIAVKCLSAPPLDALDRDVVRSFQVRLELQGSRSELAEPR